MTTTKKKPVRRTRNERLPLMLRRVEIKALRAAAAEHDTSMASVIRTALHRFGLADFPDAINGNS